MDVSLGPFGNPVAFAVAAVILGLVIGSYLNVVIYRLPLSMEWDWAEDVIEFLTRNGHRDWAQALQDERINSPGPSLFGPRSICPSCFHRLSALENVPLLSYMVQRGRCRRCRAAIPFRYPLVELMTAAGFLACALRFGPGAPAIATAAFTAILIALTVIDLDRQLLPDPLTAALLWLGLLASLAGWFTNVESAVLGAAAGFATFWIIAWLYGKLRGLVVMGRGDMKLLAALGAWLGWQALPMVVLAAAVFGILGGLCGLILKGNSWRRQLAFGPSLALAGFLVLLFGDDVTAWLRLWTMH